MTSHLTCFACFSFTDSMRIHRWGASGMRTRLAKTSPRAGLRAVSTLLAGHLLSAILSVWYAPMAPLSLDRSSGKPVSSATIGRCDCVLRVACYAARAPA
jgi:hypothetical protein